MSWWRNLRARLGGRVRPAYWSILDPHFNRVSIYDGPTVYLEQLASTPRPVQLLLAAHWAQSEIQNGGLAQFFFNSTGVVAPEAVKGFLAIGMREVAETLADAMTVFPNPYPRDRDERLAPFDLPNVEDGRIAFRAFVASTSEKFEPQNGRLWTLMGDEAAGFLSLANAYVEQHR